MDIPGKSVLFFFFFFFRENEEGESGKGDCGYWEEWGEGKYVINYIWSIYNV